MTNYKTVFQLAQDKGYAIDKTKLAFDNESEERRNRFILIELTLIQKWLRDEHKIYVLPKMDNENYFYTVTEKHPLPDFIDAFNPKVSGGYPTYEAALLEGTYEALKLIP